MKTVNSTLWKIGAQIELDLGAKARAGRTWSWELSRAELRAANSVEWSLLGAASLASFRSRKH